MMDSIVDQFDAAGPDASDDLPPPTELDVELDPPVVLDKKPFRSLHLREPTALQVAQAESELQQASSLYTLRKYQIALVAAVAQVPRGVVERIRITELGEAWRFLEPFTPLFRLTGESLWRTSPAGGAGDRATLGT